MKHEHKVYPKKTRLDVYLLGKYPDYSRAFLAKLCKTGKVKINGEEKNSGYKLLGGEKIEIDHDMESIIGVTPDIDLPIIYEDDNVIVINKPAGILSHGLSKFLGEPSVASFLRQRLKATPKDEWNPEDIRFGIVHRLDRVTSGIMICAKNKETMHHLQKQFRDRTTEKVYIAIAEGHIKIPEAILDLPIDRNPKAPSTFRVGPNGKPSSTRYKVAREFENESGKYALVELYPKTGRTHQLRVHMKHIKHPIVGDMLYDGQEAERLYLHAHTLSIDIPGVGPKKFTSDLPEEFKKFETGK
jgi:23S rRNA pseudouridine1911/1915/1917 synthase